MTQGDEGNRTRSWAGDVPAANAIDQVRPWLVWGVGPPPERAADPEAAGRPGEPAGDVGLTMAAGADPEWAGLPEDGKWAVIVEDDENDVDLWAEEDDSVRGYAPYLLEREDAAAEPGIQSGVLRPDNVVRRKAKRFDAARPE